MWNPSSPFGWLPAVLMELAVASPAAESSGRHAAPKENREFDDPGVDDDPFVWLGLRALPA